VDAVVCRTCFSGMMGVHAFGILQIFKSHVVSCYTHKFNLISARQKSIALMKLSSLQLHFVRIYCTEYHTDRTINVGS